MRKTKKILHGFVLAVLIFSITAIASAQGSGGGNSAPPPGGPGGGQQQANMIKMEGTISVSGKDVFFIAKNGEKYIAAVLDQPAPQPKKGDMQEDKEKDNKAPMPVPLKFDDILKLAGKNVVCMGQIQIQNGKKVFVMIQCDEKKGK